MGGCSSSGTLTANQMEGRLRAARATHSLSLKGLRLKAIPAEVLGLGDKLRSLDLSGNLNIDLAGVECLGSLRKLSVNGCKLVSLPPLASMTSLEELSAAHNSLSDLPSLPPSLLSLDASRNQLTTVPSGLAACDGLESLSLSGNEGLALSELVGRLPRLRELLVADCSIASLARPVDWSRCSALQTVDAARNAIAISRETVPTALLVDTALSKLVLEGNPGASQAALMAVPGFDAFAARRKARLDKVIAGGFSKDHDILSS